MCFHEVERSWNEDRTATQEEFARSIQRALRRRRRKWAETLDFGDLRQWVAQLWPLPPQAALTITDWADAYYRKCTNRPRRRIRSAA